MLKLIGKLPIQKTLVSRNSIKTVPKRVWIRRYYHLGLWWKLPNKAMQRVKDQGTWRAWC